MLLLYSAVLYIIYTHILPHKPPIIYSDLIITRTPQSYYKLQQVPGTFYSYITPLKIHNYRRTDHAR